MDLRTRATKRLLATLLLTSTVAGALGLTVTSANASSTVAGEADTSTVERRLLDDPDVLWVGTWDSADWQKRHGVGSFGNSVNTAVGDFTAGGSGNQLRAKASSGSTNGFFYHANLASAGVGELDEAYYRYRVYFPADYVWQNATGGGHGKLPGLAGKIAGGPDSRVGSGGRRWNGSTEITAANLDDQDSWSARLLWMKDGGLSTYLYVPDPDHLGPASANSYFGYATRCKVEPGNTRSSNKLFNKGAWNTVEQHVRMNTPGQSDGIFELWMNGELCVRMTDVRFRSARHPDVRISQQYVTWFYGGPTTDAPDRDSYIHFDDAVLSRSYIGPRADTAAEGSTPGDDLPGDDAGGSSGGGGSSGQADGSGSTGSSSRPAGSVVVRSAGTDAIGTSIASSNGAVAGGSATAAVLASVQSFADGLVGTPLAARHGGPMLLTSRDSLDARVGAEIDRVLGGDGVVYVLGGHAAVAEPVVSAVRALGYDVVRLAGRDRYATAAVVAETIGSPAELLLATGRDFPDALAAGAAAAARGGAVLLTAGDVLPDATAAYLAEHPAVPVVALGGPAAASRPGTRAIVGADRYQTAALAAEQLFVSPSVIGVASGQRFADALSGGAAIATVRGPLLLTPATQLAPAAQGLLARKASVEQVRIFGGTAVVADAVATTAERLLAGR